VDERGAQWEGHGMMRKVVGFVVDKVALGQLFSEYFIPPKSPSS
jgi:hypothetical protein